MTTPVTRRGVLGAMTGTLGLLLASGASAGAAPGRAQTGARALRQDAPTGPYTLPELPYSFDALEPHIDAMTMEIHHDRHHKAYVDNVNKAVADYPELHELEIGAILADLSVVPEAIRTAVRNNLGGHVNHSMFWELMSPDGGAPGEALAAAITASFGTLEEMQAAVNDAGLKRFGSGWAWVVVNGGALEVLSTPNQDNPIMDGLGTPILGIDVWEHAYYLTYQNKRADYLTAWWSVANWAAIDAAFAAATSA